MIGLSLKNIFLVMLIISPLLIKFKKRKILFLFDFKRKTRKKATTTNPLTLPRKDNKVAIDNKILFLIDISK